MPDAKPAVLEVALAFYPPALLNHCLRSYVWAVARAQERGVDYDDELLYAAAVLHDLGLTDEFDSHTVAFEEAGGHAAWVFAAGAGWPVERRDRLREIIVLHMRDDVPPETDAEAHLLQVGVTLDVSGGRFDEFPDNLKVATLERYPRLGFAAEIGDLCTAQSTRKPGSAAAAAVTGGIPERALANPLDTIGPAA